MTRLNGRRTSLRKSLMRSIGSSATPSSPGDEEARSSVRSSEVHTEGTASWALDGTSMGDDEDPDFAFLDGPAREKKAVVAIDFGTTNTGLAYGMTAKRRVHILREKEPTCALFDRKGSRKKKLIEFGQAARDSWRRSQAGQQLVATFFATEQTGWNANQIYIDQAIKMELYEATKGNDEALEEQAVKDAGGITYFEVVSSILGYLRKSALREIAKRENETLDTMDVLWVITVPSVWRESDKQFMRRCAFEGDLITDEFSGDLVIALESECAAVWAEAVIAQTDEDESTQLKPGQKVVCLDCGGGTVDVAAIALLEPEEGSNAGQDEGAEKELRMSQLLPPTGLHIGAKDVDKQFFHFLGALLGESALETALNTPDVRLELQDGWERIKLSLKPTSFDVDNGVKVKFSLEATLMELGLKLHDIVPRFNRGSKIMYDSSPIKIDYKRTLTRPSTTILLPPSLFRYCFDYVVDSIVELTKDTIIGRLSLAEVDHIILFGGLGGSCYLKKKLHEAFQEDTHILIHVAHKPNLTVMKGAVKFGFYPSIIRSRRARVTVGIKVTMPFQRSKHNKKPHIRHRAYDKVRREYYIKDAFKTFVRRGQLVDVEREYSHTFEPASSAVSQIKFDIYATPNEECDYVTEPGCQKLATIWIDVNKGEMRRVICSLSFGYTEITAKVIDTDGEILHHVPVVYYREVEEAILRAAVAQEQMETMGQYDLASALSNRLAAHFGDEEAANFVSRLGIQDYSAQPSVKVDADENADDDIDDDQDDDDNDDDE
ncbi:Heat shock 70 kDa protein 12A [Hondaea fermentalgiana]|uniref:Heat shock 70 kDa protein 12A n=1 Tax=Hondaea fermentalgiana TaxID=2315210 RepID=A0A2R5GUJ7_9STRA|nr:Heat shock 70 kDa protein 12A [Hondaea fermentalgiana]|eukprot:GBG31564.1 Heat shock 70 kDa protein 12A [Hondaea fermentalgiana]